jgi:hypothetical protein
MLSFNAIGMPCSGPRTFPSARSRSLLGLAQHVRIDRDHGIELLVVQRDSRQVLLNQFARRDAPARHRLLHVRDAGFDDVEFGPRLGNYRRKKQNGQKPLHYRPLPNQDCCL